MRRFRIAFSFAGEKRPFVEEVAKQLAKTFGEEKILYDKFHEAEFARHDLGIYLPRLYGEQADLIVPVLCKDYDQKRWTDWEWLHIYGLLTKQDGRRVMPSRFDFVEVDGFSPAAGFIELDQKSPSEFAALILERLADNEGRPKDYYLTLEQARPARTAIPNNLPRLQAFFGREAELAQIAEALDPDNRTWGALIDGPGGMGKTSLAVRAAYDCSADLFDLIVFVSIKDREMDDDGVRQLTGLIIPGLLEMLNEIARELRLKEFAKSPEDQRIRLLLDALRSQRALLILDNLESLSKADRDQLFNFVKRLPQGCKAIMTSRRRIGSGSEELILEELDQRAALATLAELAHHNKLLAKTGEEQRMRLYRQTGGKPLLLRWLAGQLGRGSCRTLDDALDFLSRCPPDNDPLEFIFGDLVNEFSDDETSVLSVLSYFALPAAIRPVAEIAGLPENLTEDALRCLANRSLVVPDTEERHFSLVPLVGEFLRRRRPDGVAAAGGRLKQRAYALIVENGYKNYDLFAVLDAEWSSLAPALPILLDGPNDKLQTTCRAIVSFLDFTGRWDEWLALETDAEAKALAAGDDWNAGWRAFQAGWVQNLRGQVESVLACAERAERHWLAAERSGRMVTREKSVVARLQGSAFQIQGQYDAAIEIYRVALDSARSLEIDSVDVAITANDLAEVERLSGDLDAAERDYLEALRIAKKLNYLEGIAYITSNLAGLELDRNDWQTAEQLARDVLVLSETLGRRELIAENHHRIAQALVRQGNLEDALPYAEKAVEIYTLLSSPNLENALETLAECRQPTGEG